MISRQTDISKQILGNEYDCETFPLWCDIEGLIGYQRTSPNQSGEQRRGDYQGHCIEQVAAERGKTLAGLYRGVGERGDRIGPESTPQLWAAMDHARFTRKRSRLAGRFADVAFISIVPLWTDPSDLPGIRKRSANEFNPNGKGGRPRNQETNFALPFILARLGRSWASIARELTDGWTGKRVQRTLLASFEYVPLP